MAIVQNDVGYVDEAKIVELVQLAFVTNGNVRLRGETGTGKTYMVHWLCGADAKVRQNRDDLWSPYGLRTPTLSKFSCHEDQSYVDIVAQDVLINGETKVRKQILLQWLEPTEDDKTPKILLIDEANFLSPAVSGFLHSLCDWQAGIWVPELGEYVKRSPLHWVAMCINPAEKRAYYGTMQMNAALSGRFITIDVPYMSQSTEQKFLKAKYPNLDTVIVNKLVAFADKTRKAYKKELLSVPVTPRNLMAWCDAMDKGKLSVDEVMPYIFGIFSPDEGDPKTGVVKGLLEGGEIDKVFKQAGVQ